MTRITVNLKRREIEALFLLAEKEYRQPRAQAAFIIRQALEKERLLEPPQPITPEEGQETNANE